jgi:hypothetical protein
LRGDNGGAQKGESTSIISFTSRKPSPEYILKKDSRLHETRKISIKDYVPSVNLTFATKLCKKEKKRKEKKKFKTEGKIK